MVTVAPATFNFVLYDGDHIAELAAGVAGRIGLPDDLELHVDVDEASMLQRVEVVEAGGGRVVVRVQGGAFEDRKRRRELSDDAVRSTLARVLYRVRDRMDPEFGPAPRDAELDLQQLTAWDAYSLGRAQRSGLADERGRRHYHFRNRHGFNDVADAVFERLWAGSGLTWADIEQACAETAAARRSVGV